MSSDPDPIDNRGPLLQSSTIALLVLAVPSFALRAYVRACMIKSFGMDDWLMTGAAVFYVLYSACVLSGVAYGTGRHFEDLSMQDAQRALKFWFFCYLSYFVTMVLSKLSIGIFLLRIVVHRVYVWILYGAMVVSSIAGFVFFLIVLLQCQPVAFFWDKTLSGTCISIDIIIDLTYMYSAVNIFCDFTFALLPIAIIRKLNMPLRMKVATMPLLTMGCVASGAVVVRLAYVQTFRDPEFLYATVDVALWSTTEAALAITAGSLACTRPLFKTILHRLGLSNSDGQYHKNTRDKLEQGRQFPPTIGSAQTRPPADLGRMGSLVTYVTTHSTAGKDTEDALPIEEHGVSLDDYQWRGERQSSDAFGPRAGEVKSERWPPYTV